MSTLGRFIPVGVILVSTFLVACATGDEPLAPVSPSDSSVEQDATADIPTNDVSPDTEVDTSPPDGEVDQATPDSDADAGLDAPADVETDVPLDVPEDTVIPDTSTDTPVDVPVDQGVDSPIDTGADVPTDTGFDVPTDTGADVPIDSGCPTLGCSDGTESRAGCANSRVIGRLTASSGSGYEISDDTCTAANLSDDPDPACRDSGTDHAYRIFMRQGETIQVTLEPFLDCNFSSWFPTLKIYAGLGCTGTTCNSKEACASNLGAQHTEPFTAGQDGWHTIVVDGFESIDLGNYRLAVTLTCGAPNCGC